MLSQNGQGDGKRITHICSRRNGQVELLSRPAEFADHVKPPHLFGKNCQEINRSHYVRKGTAGKAGRGTRAVAGPKTALEIIAYLCYRTGVQ